MNNYIVTLLQKKELVSQEEVVYLQEVVKKYPYFSIARILLALASSNNPESDTQKKIGSAAIHSINRHLFKKFLQGEHKILEAAEKAKPSKVENKKIETEKYTEDKVLKDTKKEKSHEVVAPIEEKKLEIKEKELSEVEKEVEEILKEVEEERKKETDIEKAIAEATAKVMSDEKNETLKKPTKSVEKKRKSKEKISSQEKKSSPKRSDINTPIKETKDSLPSKTEKKTLKKPAQKEKSSQKKVVTAKTTQSEKAREEIPSLMYEELATDPQVKEILSELKQLKENKKRFFDLQDKIEKTEKEMELSRRKEKKKTKPLKLEDKYKLIDKFIKESPNQNISFKNQSYSENIQDLAFENSHWNNHLISEHLAEIYLFQGHNEKAKDIYYQLILKFPKKETYFADLISKIKP